MMLKVKIVVVWCKEYGYYYDIEVDGGIDNIIIKVVVEVGVNVFVVGFYFFKVSDLFV